jgi:hypothetical protein
VRRPRPADPTCKGLLKWLKLNGLSLGALTGTDSRALGAAVHILELHNYGGNGEELEAFRIVVEHMQPSTREFAYHAVAYVGEWDYRAKVWALAGLPALDRVSVCKGER